MSKALLLFVIPATPAWADGLGPNVVYGVTALATAWLGSPLLGVILSEVLGMRSKGCGILIAAYLFGVLASTVTLYGLFRLGPSMAFGPATSFAFNVFAGGLAGAAAALLVCYRSKQRSLGLTSS